jgi:integrase/recombinase XerD
LPFKCVQKRTLVSSTAKCTTQRSPEHIAWCAQLRAIPFKKTTSTVIPYLDKSEMDALLAAPNCQTAQGRRDHALLLFLYNSGVRAEEAAQLVVGDLHLGPSYGRVLGKGGKERQCPLWSVTVQKLTVLIANRPSSDRVFLNRRARPITRFGIHALVERYVCKIKITMPSLAAKRVSPHTIRHYLPFRTMSGYREPMGIGPGRFQIVSRKASANRPT